MNAAVPMRFHFLLKPPLSIDDEESSQGRRPYSRVCRRLASRWSHAPGTNRVSFNQLCGTSHMTQMTLRNRWVIHLTDCLMQMFRSGWQISRYHSSNSPWDCYQYADLQSTMARPVSHGGFSTNITVSLIA